MKAMGQKLLNNEAEFDKKAKHCNTPPVDSGLPSVTTKRKRSSKPVSRVLYPGNRRGGDHLSSPDVTIRVKRPTRGQAGRPSVPLFGLAPDGVYPTDWSPSRW